MAEHPATAWRRLAERVAFHMGALAHDLAMLEAETPAFAPGGVVGSREDGSDSVPAMLDRNHYVSAPCPAPAAGGMCGCDDAEDRPPKVCLSRECDCL